MIVNQNTKKIVILEKVLALSVIVSIIGLFLLRIYAIYATNPIRTWDDLGYRKYALIGASDDLNIAGALQNIFYPNAHILDHTRSIGYHSWIVLGLKLSLSGDPEKVFQLANLGLLIIQALIVFYFGYWASRNKLFSGTLTFLYLSSPIVFGLNRWVMTENFVMTGLLVFGFIPVWLLDRDFRPFYRREILVGFFAAWVMGIFGSLREYAAPSYLLTCLGTLSALGLAKRWDALWGFAVGFLIFFLALIGGWIELFRFTAFRVKQSEYFHPLSQWLLHFIVHVVGVPLTLLISLVSLFIIFHARNILKEKPIDFSDFSKIINPIYLKKNLNSLQILWLVNVVLLVIYSLSILVSSSRQARSGILILIPLLNVLLMSMKMIPFSRQAVKSTLSQFFCLVLIIFAWTTSYYQLLIAFEGGKSFTHHAYDLEYYNHPLYLRPLVSPEDMHTQ